MIFINVCLCLSLCPMVSCIVLIFKVRVKLNRSTLSVSGTSGLEVIKIEFILNLMIKRNDWLLAGTCLQAASHCTLF